MGISTAKLMFLAVLLLQQTPSFRQQSGTVTGILGMYEIPDNDTGSRPFGDQQIRKARANREKKT